MIRTSQDHSLDTVLQDGCVEVEEQSGSYPAQGIVRLTGLELADRKRSRPSRGELTPFSERGGTVLLEGIAAVEVAVLVEVIVDRGMGGGKFLQGLYISEIRHRSFSSSERLVGILGSIVEPPTALLIASIADYLHRRSVRAKPIGYS